MAPRRPASPKDDKPPSLGLSGRPSYPRGKVRIGREAHPADENDAGITFGKLVVGIGLVGLVLLVIGSVRKQEPEECNRLHREAYAQAGAPAPEMFHRSIQDDINMTNCPSAAEGDYGLCLRNSLNLAQHEARVTYFPADIMTFFWDRRPRLLEPRQASSIFFLPTSYKPGFNLSHLTPTQQKGLALWSKCTYPRFGQTPTQPLNLSCPFEAFNLLFFHNTLGHGNVLLDTDSINTDLPPELPQAEAARAFSGQAGTVILPRLYSKSPLRFSVIDKAPVMIELHPTFAPNISPLQPDHTPHNLAKSLSQLLHEMIHAATYLYSCPVCYSGNSGIAPPCPAVELHDFGARGHGPMWLALAVAIDLMLSQEGVLEIPGVSWKDHRLDLHVDRVVAQFEDAYVMRRVMEIITEQSLRVENH